MIDLGVNIDHVATLRQARRGTRPDVIAAAILAEEAGASQITAHLRQDRRHIQDADIYALRERIRTRLNFEMAAVDEIIAIAHALQPYSVCLVPEKREEITTEGGLDVVAQLEHLTRVTTEMRERGIRVSMFIDPEEAQVDASLECGADAVELHTGAYANAEGPAQKKELERLRRCADYVNATGLALHAGHGLTAQNLGPIAALPRLREVNIGHDLIARAIFVGLPAAIKEILHVLGNAPK